MSAVLKSHINRNLPATACRRSRIGRLGPQGDSHCRDGDARLMAIRDEFAGQQPLRGTHHRLAAHDDPNRGADRTLRALGAAVRWASCNIFDAGSCGGGDSRQRHCGVRGRGESLADYWDYTHRIFDWPDGLIAT